MDDFNDLVGYFNLIGYTPIGEKIDNLYANVKDEDGKIIMIKIYPKGLCCAECWIEDIDFPENLIGTVILENEELETEVISAERLDVLETWGYKLRTEKGYCTITMRVSHNGYYGGSLRIREISELPDGIVPINDLLKMVG